MAIKALELGTSAHSKARLAAIASSAFAVLCTLLKHKLGCPTKDFASLATRAPRFCNIANAVCICIVGMTLGPLLSAVRANSWQKVSWPAILARSFCGDNHQKANKVRGVLVQGVENTAWDASNLYARYGVGASLQAPQRINVAEQHRTGVILNQLFPFQANLMEVPLSMNDNFMPIHVMNRNARRPKKANKGKRPCSRSSRTIQNLSFFFGMS